MKKCLNRTVLLILMLIACIVVTTSAEAGIGPQWTATYWNNVNREGDHAHQRLEETINYDWGMGSPDTSVNNDRFSATWTRTVRLPAAIYRFKLTSDDGALVKIDGDTVIDNYRAHAMQTVMIDRELTTGDHEIIVEYFEWTGRAAIKFDWMYIAPAVGIGAGAAQEVVARQWLNAYQWPDDPASQIIGRIAPNEVVALTGNRYLGTQFLQVNLVTGAIGWIENAEVVTAFDVASLTELSADSAELIGSLPNRTLSAIVIRTNRLNVYSDPGSSKQLVATLPWGTLLTLGNLQSFYRTYVLVDLPGGGQGWVYYRYLDAEVPTYSLPVLRD